MNAKALLKKISEYYNIYSMIELSKKLDTSKTTIAQWKTRNSVEPIKRKCRELDIYGTIFINNEQIENETTSELNVAQIIEKLFDYYNVFTIAKLSIQINVEQKTIYSWKTRNSVEPIKRKCRDLGIYNHIFKENIKENKNSNNVYLKQEIFNKVNDIAIEYGMSANEFIEATILKELRK